MSKTKQNKLDSLAASIIEQNICPGLATQATQLVMGSGNPDAKIVLIGEAPGKKEDQTGRPFVGASGRFLDEMLESVGMARGDVYITNIVKYRPPNNRDPSLEEKAAFLPYLLRQLAIIDPKVIITLGRHSMEYFLPDAKISDVHGQAAKRTISHPGVETKEWLIVPLYHPAAALYNRGLRQTLVDDFLRVPEMLSH